MRRRTDGGPRTGVDGHVVDGEVDAVAEVFALGVDVAGDTAAVGSRRSDESDATVAHDAFTRRSGS
ncbi:hypothetical protein [Halospeciosus flavus]|uniref:hypothetical protein n=1 Tax=Halospeciosus flavus TaxID=3032283 RepID=UPI00361D06B4